MTKSEINKKIVVEARQKIAELGLETSYEKSSIN